MSNLSDEQIIRLWGPRSDGPENREIISFARAIETTVREKGAAPAALVQPPTESDVHPAVTPSTIDHPPSNTADAARPHTRREQ